ncbi:MAG: 50S ribosomal protein L17 [Lentisphaerae bacterium RIFOXYB12_FULL_65_16]|nr:MAG: 50S ribosomal protein L17 [Lentisphaerae bacterium RIFOXYA12_64_32]OGV93303.1 MAG: 50S ribosomal protein L17 [Lentisphaerae bacterium RIFOXYB12_FULL_65_16]
MRHRKFTFKIGRTASHRRALLQNAACSLIKEERIVTTVTKAKQIRRLAERMITLGKQGTLHARRRAIALLRQPDVVGHLFRDLAARYEGRNGGYTRIIRVGTRRGDAADMCILEFLPKAGQEAAPAGTDGTPAEAKAVTQGTADKPEGKS